MSGPNRARRDQLLDLLEKADKEWGARKELMLEKEASFFRRVIDRRMGSGAVTRRIQNSLADLSVDKIEEFFSGSS